MLAQTESHFCIPLLYWVQESICLSTSKKCGGNQHCSHSCVAIIPRALCYLPAVSLSWALCSSGAVSSFSQCCVFYSSVFFVPQCCHQRVVCPPQSPFSPFLQVCRSHIHVLVIHAIPVSQRVSIQWSRILAFPISPWTWQVLQAFGFVVLLQSKYSIWCVNPPHIL